jgi:geranylgeranyl reductase family protein
VKNGWGKGCHFPFTFLTNGEAESLREVIIVGGGPVGSYTAALLSKRGFDVLILERNPAVGQRVVCTGLVGMEAFDRFQLPRGAVVNQVGDVTFFSPSGIRFCYKPDGPAAYVLDRHRFDRDMADMALSFGAELRCNTLTTDMRIREDGVTVEVEANGGRAELRAKMAVVACGFNPELTQKVGLGRPREFLRGAEAEVEMDGVGETEIYVGRSIAPGSFAWVLPINAGRAKIGMTTRENADHFLRSFLNKPVIRHRIKRHNPRINVEMIPITPIEKSFRERVLAVGEAAGQVKSTTCGGIYYGLISAEFAVETVEAAFSRSRFDNEFLRTYERRWRRELGGELEIGYRLRQIFSRIRDRQIDRLFEILNSDGIAPLIHSKARFDWHKDLILMLSRHMIFGKYLQPISVCAKRFGE